MRSGDKPLKIFLAVCQIGIQFLIVNVTTIDAVPEAVRSDFEAKPRQFFDSSLTQVALSEF